METTVALRAIAVLARQWYTV